MKKALVLALLLSAGLNTARGAADRLEFRHLVYVSYNRARPGHLYVLNIVTGKDGRDVFTFTDRKGRPVKQEQVLKQSKVILTAADFKPTARVEADTKANRFITLQFTESGRKKFADFTKRNTREILAIIVNGRILSAPVINEPILAGRAIINGPFTVQEGQRIADSINAAARAAAKGQK